MAGPSYFAGRSGGVQRLYVRALDGSEARVIDGTEGAHAPAVSPDGRFFYAVQTPSAPAPPPVTQIHLVTNWVEEMKAKVAAGQAK